MKKEYGRYYMFLEMLRKSGITNMFGAVPYLMENYNLNRDQATEILINWMSNYEEIAKTYYK